MSKVATARATRTPKRTPRTTGSAARAPEPTPMRGAGIEVASGSMAHRLAPVTDSCTPNILVDAWTRFDTEVLARVREDVDGTPVDIDAPITPDNHTDLIVRIHEDTPGSMFINGETPRAFKVTVEYSLQDEVKPIRSFEHILSVRELRGLYLALDTARERMRAAGFLI